MNGTGPVLRDIHVAPAGWWPLAPGWWLLVALLVLAAIAIGIAARWRARGRPLRAALRELDALARVHARDGDAARVLDQVSRLLRRIARRIEPAVASQTGAAWAAFVRRYARDAQAAGALDGLLERRFRREPEVDAAAVLAATRGWCRAALGRQRHVWWPRVRREVRAP